MRNRLAVTCSELTLPRGVRGVGVRDAPRVRHYGRVGVYGSGSDTGPEAILPATIHPMRWPYFTVN